MSDHDWDRALDALESLLGRQRAFLAGSGPMPDSPWASPEVPVPDGLRPRAMLLAAQCEQVESELRRLLASRSDRTPSPYR